MTITLADLTHRAGVHAYYGRQLTMATNANTPERTEAWLESLGSTFVDVQLYVKVSGHLTWMDERHIADAETLTTTVLMSLERLQGRYAVWYADFENGKGWRLFDRHSGALNEYPSREAAEMVAIHRHG